MDPGMIMGLISTIYNVVGGLTGDKAKPSSSFDKQQKGGIHDILDQIKGMSNQGGMDISQNPQFQQGGEWLNNLFGNDQGFWDKFEAPLQRQFQENTIPDLANRFASMGSGGSMGSTAFRNQLGREGSNLSTNIAALRGGMQQQGVNQAQSYAQQPISNIMQMYNQALGQPVNNQYQPANAGFFGNLATPFAQGATNYWGGQAGQNNQGNQGFAGQSPLTGNQYPLTGGYDAQFRNAGVY